MCLIDNAISRSARVRVTPSQFGGGWVRVPAAPDRIALYVTPSVTTGTVAVAMSDPTAGVSEYVYTSAAGDMRQGLTAATHPGVVGLELWVGDESGAAFGVVEVLLSPEASALVQRALG